MDVGIMFRREKLILMGTDFLRLINIETEVKRGLAGFEEMLLNEFSAKIPEY